MKHLIFCLLNKHFFFHQNTVTTILHSNFLCTHFYTLASYRIIYPAIFHQIIVSTTIIFTFLKIMLQITVTDMYHVRLYKIRNHSLIQTFLCKRQISFFQSQLNKLRINIIKSTIIIFFLKEITTS